MKLSQRKWKTLVSGVLLTISASSMLAMPTFAADYSNGLTGVVNDDKPIISAGGSTVTQSGDTITYDFQGKDHIFNVKNADAITTDGTKDYNYVYNNVDGTGKKGTLHLYQSNGRPNAWDGVTGFVATGGKVIVNSNLDITATSKCASAGITAANKADLIINGNVKMRKDNLESPWGIITDNVHGNFGPGSTTSSGDGKDYTGARWNPTGISITGGQADITVNGDVDLAVRGTAVKTDPYGSVEGVNPHDLATISLLGKSTRIDTPYREKNFVEGFVEFIEPYYSLASYGGTINVNVKNLEAQSGKVEMVGNVLAMKASDEAKNAMAYQNGCLNIGLTTQDSSWKGIIDNAGAEKAGEVNLWLQNGAQWIYENASRKGGLDATNMPEYSRPYYEKYDGISHLSSLVGGKDQASAGIIKVNDNDPIHIANAEGVTKVWYDHAEATPGTIIGGDIKVLNAKTGTEMMLYTGNNGITKGFAEGDTAAEKNKVSEVLNSLAHKLWYMAGDTNLTGSVSIAEGLTASSATMKTGNINFAEGGQGFYDYTPEKDDKTYATGPIVKSENIGETRESDVNGVVSVNVTEAQTGVSGNAPSALYVAGDAESPLVVDLQGHTLKLNANNQAANNVSTIFVDEKKSMEIKDSKGNGVLKVSAGLDADGNTDTKANYVYGIRVGENGSFTANTDVEIDGVKSGSTKRAYGLYVSSKGNVVFEKDLSIKNVQTGHKVGANTAGIYADSSSSADAPINITVKGNLNIENVLGSAIRALNTSTISTAGATIKAADMSNGTDYSQYYALQANKGTINLNTGEGITAGILDVTGDMKVTDNKASVINVNMTKGSQWTGAVSNTSSSTYNAPDGQFNLTMAEGSVWNHETGRSVDTLKTTFAGSNVSKLDGSGVIYQNSDKGINVYNYSGDTTVVYGHDANNPQNITGGDFTVKTAAADSKITLVTDSQGITGGFEASDTAAEKNNVKEVLNKLANKLFYTGYKDANLSGVVKIADGLTASSVSASVKASGDITFSDGSNGTKKAGQGFYDYTPEEDKPDYKTGAITTSENISLNREVDEKGVAHINVTESNAGNNKFASALYAGEETSPSKPMTVNMSGKGLALNAAQTSGQAAAIYAGANAHIKVVNQSADQKLAITANNTDTRGAHGIYADINAQLNISGPVEITDVVTQGDAATGINIQGQQSEINIDGPLTISNVKGLRERGAGMSAAGIQVTGVSSTLTVSGPVDISGVRGSGIKLVGKDTKVSVGGGTITAAEDSDKSHNFYAVRVDKGTLDINMKDGAAGDTTTKITGDMYATGQYGKKVMEYSGGELIDWNDAGILNVALTDKDSFWKGVAAYDQYNDDYGTGGNTAHDIGQFNLYLQNGATWTNEQQSHVTTTTIASKNPVWTGSTLATLHGGKDADNAGLIYQKDNNPISVVNYSGHTTVFYEHDAADPTEIIGGDFNITNAAKGSAITFITDNKGITSGFADGDSADAKDKVANVLNNLAGKLFYKNYADGNLAGVVKIADGLTSSSAALKTGDISFSTEDSGTKTPGQGYYDYKPSGEKPEYNTGAIKNSENISKTRELDANGIAKVEVTEPTILEGYSKFAAALYAEEASVPMNVKMAGKGLALSSAVEGGAQAAGIFVANGANITIDNPFVKQKLAITASNNDTYGAYGIFAKGDNAKLNISGPVEITDVTTKGAAVGGIVVRGQNTDVVIDGPLTISNVKAESDSAKGYNGFGIGVTGVGSTVAVNGTVDISGIHGSAILLKESGNKVSVGGGNIAAAVDSDKSHNYYAARVEKGTLDINMKDGVAGDTTTTITGDMYINCLHGMKPPSLGSTELVDFKEEGVLNVALTNADSYWKGVAAHEKYKTDKHQYGYDMHDVGDLNLYLQNGATWTNEQQSHATTTTVKDGIWDGSTLASLHGGSDAAHAGHIFQNDSKNITINNYSGNTNIYYAHTGNGEAAENYAAGDTIIKSAAAGSAVSLITDNKGVAMDNSESVAKVLNALAGKLTYSNFATEKNLKGVVKISSGLTASGAELKTGDISFSTETTGTKTPGQGYYEYDEAAENTFTDKITGGNDKKYVEAGIEKEKGVYTFTKDATIKVTKGLSELGAIESSSGPITINADGKALDVSYTVPKGDNVARAVATANSYGKSKDITIKADSLKLSADTTGFRAQGIYAVGGKITIDANTTIATSAQTESNGIYAGNGGVVTVNGDLDIKEDTKVSQYYALNADDTGVINVNIKDGKAGAGTVKLKGDIFTKTAESYDEWDDETTTSSAVNLALQGKESTWTGRSLYEITSSNGDTTSYGNFNLWLTDGASWTNEKTGKTIPKGFVGSHVTSFVGGASAAAAGNIFQNDSKNLTIDKYSGNTNIFYAHTGNGEAAENYKAGDTIIKSAATGSAVSLITDNKGVSMDNKDSVANVLNALAGKLTYSNFATGEKNLTGVVKIADGLTASSKALETGDITFNEKGQGTYVKPEPVDDTHFTEKITGGLDQKYVDLGIEKEQGVYTFVKDTVIDVTKGKDTAMVAIGSKGGPVTINAEGKTLDVSFHSDKTFAARAIASETYYGGKPITIKAGKLNLNAEAVDGESQGIFAKVGSTITIDADTTITTSSNKESNGIYAGSRGVVNMNGNLEIKEDTKAKAYYALKTDGNGVINVNLKDGNAGDSVVKFTGDIYAKTNESSINLALKGKNSQWTGRSLNESADSEKRGSFNLWLADGASWTNQVTGKDVPAGFVGSHVTSFVGGASAAAAGNIFQNDSKNLTIDKYSGNTNIFYAHTGNGEAASDFAAGDTIIKSAAAGSVVSMITDNSGISMDNEYSVANVLNNLAGKLTYSNFTKKENNLTGYVKIADGLTASSAAMQTGNISFDAETGKGSLENGSLKPGFTYPETQTPESNKIHQGITGDAKTDYQYKKDGILKDNGKYIFTQDPSEVKVSEGAAVDVNGKNVEIDTTAAKLKLTGKDQGINATGGADIKVDGNTEISGETGINATNGSNVTLNGSTVISGNDGKGTAINANDGGKVVIDTRNGALTINGSINANGGNITVDSGSATGTINGDVNASNGGSIEISLNDAQSKLTGSYKVDGSSGIVMNIKNGATWVLTDDKDEAAGMSLLQMTRGAAPAAGLTVNGGVTEGATGYLDMRSRTGKLEIAHYSGWETIIYNHDNKGSEAQDFKSGNTVIRNAKEGSGVILLTDSNNININSQAEVEAAMTVLAEKIQYTDHAANGANLKGKVRIAEGLTSAGKTGSMKWDEATGIGKFDPSSIKWSEITEGDYETFVMKGVRSAATTSMHSWRDNMQDTYTGADLADADGIFAKALGGKTSSDVKGVKDDNTYRGVQVGLDKALANGWHAGVAFDYRNGDSNYLLGGKGDNQLYSFGVYGVKNFEDQSYLRVAAKAGRVENEYDVYNEIRTLKLHGDYKANAYGLTMEYGKTFGSEASYFTPKAQLTWSQVGSKDYTAHTPNDSMRIDQDAYSSLVARFGVEAGAKSEKGRVYVGLYGAHEFNGDISASYFAKDGGIKHTSFDGSDTWMEMSIGGSYDLSDNCHIYADFAKDFGGDFERKWKASAGLRFEF